MSTNNNPNPSDTKSHPAITKHSLSCAFRVNVYKKICNFFENKIFCDVILTSKDDEYKINAHKMVLSAASDYFREMFRASTDKEFKLPIDSHSLKLVINYIYTGSIELSNKIVGDIFKASRLFQLQALQLQCCNFTMQNMICLNVALTTDHLNLEKKLEISDKKTCNGRDVFKLDADTLNKLISSNKLKVESEEEVFECIKRWVDHDKKTRKMYYNTLLHNVRLPLISPLYIANDILPACDSMECKVLIDKAFKWHLLPELRLSLFSEKLTQPRYSKHTLIAISGWVSEHNLDTLSVGKFSFEFNDWIYTTWPAPKNTFRHSGAKFEYAVLDEMLVVAGGYDHKKHTTDRVDYLDLKSRTWKCLSPMKAKRKHFGLAVLNGCLYAYGGEMETIDNVLEKWNPLAGNWSYVSFTKKYRSNVLVTPKYYLTACNGTLFQLEVINNNKHFAVYNFSERLWEQQWAICDGKSVLGVGVVRSKSKELLIIVSVGSIMKYDVGNANGSKNILSVPTIGTNFTNCAMFDDHVVIFGDTDFKIYYPFIDHWRTLPPLKNTLGRVVVI